MRDEQRVLSRAISLVDACKIHGIGVTEYRWLTGELTPLEAAHATKQIILGCLRAFEIQLEMEQNNDGQDMGHVAASSD